MNVSLNWLKEYVDLDESITIKEVVERITMTGTKVETYKEFGKRCENVVTGKVESVEKHTEDKDLLVLKLNIGNKILKAVAKIPDIEVGDIVPVALPGAKLIGKEIKVSKVKGLMSECMVCHILDLGLDMEFSWCKPSGLISFPKDVQLGKNVNEVLGLGDYLIEFEITPNRPDCMSIEGIANELALTFDKQCKKLYQHIEPKFDIVKSIDEFKANVESDNCNRYIAGNITDICVKPSPFDMQLKLIKCGIRPINNIVDITNYVMLELGQPLHAFDKEKIGSNEIIVRQARENEKIETLDGVVRELNTKDLVITNSKVPIAIAGVMGGDVSSITDSTKNIIIESASFKRASIRNTSKRIGLRTDASARYEKGLPTDLTAHAINRVYDLINYTNSGKMKKEIIDIYPNKYVLRKIDIDYDKINSVIGMNISKELIDQMLNKALINTNDSKAYIPYTRDDVKLNEDLAEEIARIYGYDRLLSTLPSTELTFGEKTFNQKMEDKIKEVSFANGYNEIYTYTFFNRALLDRMNIPKESNLRNCIKVKNPLSEDFEYMRTTAMPLMLEALEKNYTKKNKEVKLFELGKVFSGIDSIAKNELGKEEKVLTIGMYDNYSTYYNLKSDIENLLNVFKILENNYSIERINDLPEYHFGISARIKIGEDIIAEYGKLSPKIGINYMLPENTYIATIYFENILKYMKKEIKFVELPKYPAVERDIAFVIDKEVLSYDIIKKISDIDLVENVVLFDVYEGKQIEDGKKSMAYSIYLRSNSKTLNDKDINDTMKKVYDVLNNDFNAKIRE